MSCLCQSCGESVWQVILREFSGAANARRCFNPFTPVSMSMFHGFWGRGIFSILQRGSWTQSFVPQAKWCGDVTPTVSLHCFLYWDNKWGRPMKRSDEGDVAHIVSLHCFLYWDFLRGAARTRRCFSPFTPQYPTQCNGRDFCVFVSHRVCVIRWESAGNTTYTAALNGDLSGRIRVDCQHTSCQGSTAIIRRRKQVRIRNDVEQRSGYGFRILGRWPSQDMEPKGTH